MKDSARKGLIERLISSNLSKEKYSEMNLFKLHEKFKTEVELNIAILNSFQQSYLYLKDNEFAFLEVQKSYYNKSKIPEQLELFQNEADELKKSRN